jgi:SAM-dependent methyltransferase
MTTDLSLTGQIDPKLSDCVFYHTIDIAGYGVVEGMRDTRGFFDPYIGNIQLEGKTLLDIGTASGFFAFEAEKRGATVTAFDIASGTSQVMLPFADSLFMKDRAAWVASADANLRGLRNSFWFCHKRLKSKVRPIFSNFTELAGTPERFDIVMAGAILEHISDPVSAIGLWCKLARETVVIPSTPLILSEDLLMRPITSWDNPIYNYTWFELSIGLYRRIFTNMGFRLHNITYSKQIWVAEGRVVIERPTIVAQRV